MVPATTIRPTVMTCVTSPATARSSASATDIAGMQRAFDRHSKSLPSRTCSTLSCGDGKIAIIGSTGFLGPYIVAALLETAPHIDILCLNRSHDAKDRTTTAVRRIVSDGSINLSRLQFVETDITRPYLGLESAQAVELASQIDELIFSAWDSNWIKPLQQFDPFLKGITNAVSFCTLSSRRVRITSISSICAVGNWPLFHRSHPKIPEEVIDDRRCAMPHGYGESKWIAEQLLAHANRELGLPVNIFRVGQIGGPSSRQGLWPRQGWLLSIMVTSRKLGQFPNKVQPLDWMPVDSLADGVASSVQSLDSGAGTKVFNVVHPQPGAWNILYNTLRHDFGLDAQLVSLPQWLSRIPDGQLKLLGFLDATEGGREHNMAFENTKAIGVLPPVQPITQDLLCAWLRSWDLKSSTEKARL